MNPLRREAVTDLPPARPERGQLQRREFTIETRINE